MHNDIREFWCRNEYRSGCYQRRRNPKGFISVICVCICVYVLLCVIICPFHVLCTICKYQGLVITILNYIAALLTLSSKDFISDLFTMHSDDMVICFLNVRGLSNNTIFTTFSSSRAGRSCYTLFNQAPGSTTIFNFQFWNILPTPKEVNSSDQCSFYKESSETLLHLFWEFPFVKSFWNEIISNWMENSSCFLKEEFSFSSY